MCGIAGIINKKENIQIKNILFDLLNSLKHRGPDDENIVEINKNTGFVHTRLSIIDLSNKGSQPMKNQKNGDYLSFNGEIYNHLFIREKLEDEFQEINWIGNSDTETLLKSLEYYGLEKTLQLIKGMYAFSYYDHQNNKIYLVRDNFGEKPLYYLENENYFVFSSEIKSFKCLEEFNLELDSKNLNKYLINGYLPNPFTMFKNIKKIPPGNILEINLLTNNIIIKKYFHIEDFFEKKTSFYSQESLTSDVESLLIRSVERQMISDRPIGIFLSGGVDSSLIASLAAKINPNVSTFTIGFENFYKNENLIASRISSELGLKHHSLTIKKSEIINLIENSLKNYDDPISDPVCLASNFISKFSKNKVDVALSGEGSDELCMSYDHYKHCLKINNLINNNIFKNKFTKNLIYLLDKSPESLKNFIKLFGYKNPYFSIKKLYNLTSSKDLNEFYNEFKSQYFDKIDNDQFSYLDINKNQINLMKIMQLNDIKYYLSDNILERVDRSAMKYGLETRCPFLDIDLYKYIIGLDQKYKTKYFKDKFIFKKILNKYLNPEIFNRKKQGFSIPISIWLKNELKDWSYEILKKENLIKIGIQNHKYV